MRQPHPALKGKAQWSKKARGGTKQKRPPEPAAKSAGLAAIEGYRRARLQTAQALAWLAPAGLAREQIIAQS